MAVQPKAYCRDVLTQRARLRVTLRNELDVPINPDVPDRACCARSVPAQSRRVP